MASHDQWTPAESWNRQLSLQSTIFLSWLHWTPSIHLYLVRKRSVTRIRCLPSSTVVSSVFQLGVSMPSTTVSSLLLFGFETNCRLKSLCPLPSRSSSLDWWASQRLRRQLRDIRSVLSRTSARFYLSVELGFIVCFLHFMHVCHARHYSTLTLRNVHYRKRRKKKNRLVALWTCFLQVRRSLVLCQRCWYSLQPVFHVF